MARIKITVPPGRIFSTDIGVRITDINYGNHLGNDALVSILHEVRMQWLASGNYTELDIAGVGLIMSDLVVEFKKEAFYGDRLSVRLVPADIQKIGFELYYEVSTEREGTTILIANAKTGMVCYDYAAKKVTPLPEDFVNFLQQKT